jgi:sugar diacid utilization regulator
MLSTDLAGEFSRRLAARVSEAVSTVRGSELVILLPASSSKDTLELARKQAAIALEVGTALLEQRSITVQLTCGLSEQLGSADTAPRGLQQASDAVDLGVRIGRAGSVVAYDDLGVYRLLLQIGDMRQLWHFAEDVLGELITYEAAHSLDLIGTLSVYLQEHASLKRAAWRLRVHTNTISYRINRIEELTRLRLDDAEDRLSAHVAVKIIESQRTGRQVPGAGEPVVGVTAFRSDGG